MAIILNHSATLQSAWMTQAIFKQIFYYSFNAYNIPIYVGWSLGKCWWWRVLSRGSDWLAVFRVFVVIWTIMRSARRGGCWRMMNYNYFRMWVGFISPAFIPEISTGVESGPTRSRTEKITLLGARELDNLQSYNSDRSSLLYRDKNWNFLSVITV